MTERHTIIAVEHVGSSNAASVLYEGMHEIMQAMMEHWPSGSYPADLNGPAIMAIDQKTKDVVGILVYEQMDHYTLEITLAYVELSSRRQGVFTSLYEELKRIGRQKSTRRIVLDTAFNNPEMTHTAAALKMLPIVKTYAHSF